MIGLNFKYTDESRNVVKAIDKAAYRSFAHAGASIRKDIISTIQKAPIAEVEPSRRTKGKGRRRRKRTIPSAPGTPFHTRRGAARRAYAYAADKEGVVIGPRYSIVGTAIEPHEKGIPYKGQDYPKRAAAVPAMERQLPRFAAGWKGILGNA